jgi:peptidyl-prolyl cis-trans isomerase B (cyclophilin B)
MLRKIFIVLVGSIFLFSCDKNTDYVVVIHTPYGDMKAILYDETPLHKANFLKLAKSGRYDSTVFHRVIENFMIQGGDINTKEGTREEESDRIPAEIIEGFYHTKGALAAARQGDKSNPKKLSSSCQFYIVDGTPWQLMSTNMGLLNAKLRGLLKDPEYADLLKQFKELAAKRDSKGMNDLAYQNKQLIEEKFGIDLTLDPKTKNNEAYKELGGSPHLDGAYTVFGKVVEGLDVIDKIAEQKIANRSKPIEDIFLTIDVQEMKKSEITEMYGYSYPEE